MKKFWAVWRENGGSAPNYRHETLESAKQEAARLACKSVDSYYILEAVGVVTIAAPPTEYKDL